MTDPQLPSFRSILIDPEPAFSRTKLICSLTTNTSTVDSLVKMMDAGMSAIRILLSQSDQKTHLDTFRKIREAHGLRPHHQCGVMLETRGTEMVTGVLKHHQAVSLSVGQEVQLLSASGIEGDSSTLVCAYESLPRLLKLHDFVYFDDGAVIGQVTEVLTNGANLVIVEGGEVGERKNIIIPGASLHGHILSDKDEEDIEHVVLKQNVDFLVLSSVRTAADVSTVREHLNTKGSSVKILSKLQNREAIENFEQILSESDGVVISAFELSLNLPQEKYALVQEAIVEHANARGKPVLLVTDATTKAFSLHHRQEINEISTSIVIGVDALILPKSGTVEHQVEALRVLTQISKSIEPSKHYQYHAGHARSVAVRTGTAVESACYGAVQSAQDAHVKLMLVLTGNNFNLGSLMKFKPAVPLVILTQNELASASIFSGCTGVKPQAEAENRNIEDALRIAKELGLASSGDRVMVVSASEEPESSGTIKLTAVS